jgi:Ca2+-binding RTX toxin-like protein
MANIIFLPFERSGVEGTAYDDVFVCDSGSFIPAEGAWWSYDAGHLKAGYKIVGGDGYDIIELNADTSISFGAQTFSGIEQIWLDTDADIGAGPGHAYQLIMNDGNVKPGQMLVIEGVYSTSLVFDGSAETNGSFDIVGGRGPNIIIGGGGDDTFLVEHGGGSVNGGGGDDLVLAGGVRGDNQPDPIFHDGDLQGGDGTDTLWLDRAFLRMTHFDAASSGFERMEGSPDIAAGKDDNTLDFSGFTVLTPDNRLIAHGGAGNDVLTGWSADNFLFGDDGNDQLAGGSARNTFVGGAGADTLIAGVGGISSSIATQAIPAVPRSTSSASSTSRMIVLTSRALFRLGITGLM